MAELSQIVSETFVFGPPIAKVERTRLNLANLGLTSKSTGGKLESTRLNQSLRDNKEIHDYGSCSRN